MNRTEGLVRRVKNREGAEGASTQNGATEDGNDNQKESEEQDMDDNDAKETRLTLMEEVLLLGLKDKEVSSIILSTLSLIIANKGNVLIRQVYVRKAGCSEWDKEERKRFNDH